MKIATDGKGMHVIGILEPLSGIQATATAITSLLCADTNLPLAHAREGPVASDIMPPTGWPAVSEQWLGERYD